MELRTEFARWRQLVAAGIVAALAAAPSGAQTSSSTTQQPQPPRSSQGLLKFRVESDLVLVNVVVRDKQGQPVMGLKKEDFTLLEDGKPQQVSSFDFESLDTAPLTTGGPAQTSVNEAPAKPILSRKDAEEALNNKRVIVLFFDLSSLGPDETQRSVDAARKYVQTKMTAADMIAIVSLASSLRLDQDFTADRSRLLRVLNRFTHSEGQGMDAGPTGDADGIEESGNAYTPDETEYNQFNTDRKL